MNKVTKDLRGYYWFYFRRARLKTVKAISTTMMRIICFCKRVNVGKGVSFVGITRLHRYPLSSISIGDNCRFNSSRNAVSIGLYKPCSLTTIRANAKIILGKNVGGTGITIAAANNVTIGDNVLIGAYTFIMDTDWHNTDPDERNEYTVNSSPVMIEDNVFLGYNCLVLKGVTIGKNSIIGANSVVLKSIPPNSIAMGNPCKVLIKRNWEEVAENQP